MFLILIIFCTIITIVVFTTYRTKNSKLLKLKIIVPPLLLIPVYWFPWDMATFLFWFPAIIAFLFSIISILIRIVTIIIRVIVHKPQPAMTTIKFIRPVLTVLIFLFVAISVNLSVVSADKFAIKTAKEIQAVADANGICPEKLGGWEPSYWDPNVSVISYGKYGTKYPIKYIPSKDLKEFQIKVRHHIDYALFIYGGVNTPLTRRCYVEGEWVKVPLEEIK